MKTARRSILHVDLQPFFVSVERSLDASLRAVPLVVGGDREGHGIVAAASEEAAAAGVRVGMPLGDARALCPAAAFRPGDLETYGRVSEDVTTVLLSASRRVERPSADEAFVDLTPEAPGAPAPLRAAERIRDELQRRLRLHASLGLASSRIAARIASEWARPRGLLAVLPGYELSFLAGKPLSVLELPPHLEAALERAGLATLGQLAACGDDVLDAVAGPAAARLRAAARGADEPAIALAVPPAFVQEEQPVRDRRSDAAALADLADALARRATRRIKPFRLAVGSVAVEVRRAAESSRRVEMLQPPLQQEEEVAALVRTMAVPLLEPAEGVRLLHVRLGRLVPPSSQAPLFPAMHPLRRAR